MHPLFAGVIDGPVRGVFVFDTDIALELIGVNRISVRGVVDELVESLARAVADDLKPDLSTALGSPGDDNFLARMKPSALALGCAEEGFVYFHDSTHQFGVLFFHRGANALCQVPSGFVGDAQHSLELIARDPFLALTDHVDGQKPLPERQLGIVEDRLDTHRELVATSVAIELAALFDATDFVGLAPGGNGRPPASAVPQGTRGTCPHCRSAQSVSEGRLPVLPQT